MAEFLTSLRTFASKAETTPGTAVTLASADNNVRVWDLAIGSLDVPMDADPSKYATGDPFLGESIPGPTSAKITFTTKFVNKTGGLEPNWTKFAKTCGCSVSGYNSTLGSGFMIFPTKYAMESGLSIGVYDLERGSIPSGLFYQFVGGVGNCVISTEGTGKPYKMAWEYTAALNDINDISEANVPVLTSPDTEIPDRFLNGFLTISGAAGPISGCISTMEFNMGNTVSPVECQSSSTGYSKFAISSMEPSLTINRLVSRNTDYDFWAKLTAGTIEAVWISTSQFALYIPRAQITSASPADSDGIQRNSITFRPLRASTAHATAGYAPWYLVIKS